MSKPDWKDAPEWAQWMAMDQDGGWWWHERKPAECGNDWSSLGKMVQAAPQGELWRSTLEQRPETKEQS